MRPVLKTIEKQRRRLKLQLIVKWLNGNKDIGKKITSLEEMKASLLRDSLTQAYETSLPVLCSD